MRGWCEDEWVRVYVMGGVGRGRAVWVHCVSLPSSLSVSSSLLSSSLPCTSTLSPLPLHPPPCHLSPCTLHLVTSLPAPSTLSPPPCTLHLVTSPLHPPPCHLSPCTFHSCPHPPFLSLALLLPTFSLVPFPPLPATVRCKP